MILISINIILRTLLLTFVIFLTCKMQSRTTVAIYLASRLFFRFIVTRVYFSTFSKNNYTSSADDCLKIYVLCCVVIE